MIAALALALLAQAPDLGSCRDAAPSCRQACAARILAERELADLAEDRARDLELMLAARTSTAIAAITPVQTATIVVDRGGLSTEWVVAIGVAAAVIGGVAGALIAGGGPDTVVVR